MKRQDRFPMKGWRRVTPVETEMYRKMIENTLGVKRPPRGRPPKGADKSLPVYIRLDPRTLRWARGEAKRRGIGYQTFINQALLALAVKDGE
ncbi:MAG: AT hook motif protein [Proteobacteria bacterium]|nr:AT hook motif protein [Pseudomonadota bacterium]